MSYDLFDGIELPKRSARGPSAKYPFAEMPVNQSFFVTPNEGETVEKAVKRLAGSAARARKALGNDRKFAVRPSQHPSTLEACVGVWRTE